MINVVKASGITEQFNESKLQQSILASGVPEKQTVKAIDVLTSRLNAINSTEEIHHHVSSYLRDEVSMTAYFNYGLKRAIMALGPSGHPFEVLVSDILRQQGYKTEVGVITLGKCVTHEIDVIALKDDHQSFIECKFHNSPGTKTDIQVALYSYARFLDIQSVMDQKNTHTHYSSWIFTNTKVTTEVLSYAHCIGIQITSWLDPEGLGLHELIIRSGLHPITLLHYLPAFKIQQLLNKGIVTCISLENALLNNQVDDILNHQEIETVLKDIKQITI